MMLAKESKSGAGHLDKEERLNHLLDLGDRGLRYAEKVDNRCSVEIYLNSYEDHVLSIKDSNFDLITSKEETNIAVRVYRDGVLGTSSTTLLSDESMEQTIKSAINIASSVIDPQKSPISDGDFFSHPGQLPSIKDLEKKGLESITADDFVEPALASLKSANQFEPKSVLSGSGANMHESVVVANTNGVSHGYSKSVIQTFFTCTLPLSSENIGFGYESKLNYEFTEDIFDTVSTVAIEKARDTLNPKQIKTQALPVIIAPRAGISWLSSVINAGVNGKEVLSNASFFTDKIGELVCNDEISINDVPLHPNGLSTSPMDDEGTPRSNLSIVKDGVLQTYLSDCFTSKSLNTRNTGHATRGSQSLTSRPAPNITQLHISEGNLDLETMISELKSGVLLESGLTGFALQGTNISEKVNRGFYIEDGEILHPLTDTLVATNVSEFLFGISGISQQVEEYYGNISPGLYVEKMMFSSSG